MAVPPKTGLVAKKIDWKGVRLPSRAKVSGVMSLLSLFRAVLRVALFDVCLFCSGLAWSGLRCRWL